MKIKIEFGNYDGIEFVTWNKTISDFPKLLNYQGNIYSFSMYSLDTTHQNDYVFRFSQTKHYSVAYYDIPTFNDLFRSKTFDNGCHCGSKHDRGNPSHHYVFCPKWKPKE